MCRGPRRNAPARRMTCASRFDGSPFRRKRKRAAIRGRDSTQRLAVKRSEERVATARMGKGPLREITRETQGPRLLDKNIPTAFLPFKHRDLPVCLDRPSRSAAASRGKCHYRCGHCPAQRNYGARRGKSNPSITGGSKPFARDVGGYSTKL